MDPPDSEPHRQPGSQVLCFKPAASHSTQGHTWLLSLFLKASSVAAGRVRKLRLCGSSSAQTWRAEAEGPGGGLARCLLGDSVSSVVEEAMTLLCCWCTEHARKFMPAAKLSPRPSSHTDLRLWAGSSWNCIRTSEALGMPPALKF